jgi:uncharacterized protein (DUF1684 family)
MSGDRPRIFRLAVMGLLTVCLGRPALSSKGEHSSVHQAPGREPDAAYLASIGQWRVDHDAELKADEGWLALIGLTWLKDGPNTVGRGRDCAIVVESDSMPARAGVFDFRAGVTTFTPEPGQIVRINGQPAARRVLSFDPWSADRVQVGTVSMLIIKRGNRYGVRIRDTSSRSRREFTGARWFPVSRDMAVTARFVKHEKPASIMIANVLGDIDPWPSPGYVVFTLGGKELRLDPVVEGASPRRLFFIIKDQTSGKETYGGGRFLYTDMPKDGKVLVDFNKAENPPCAYTPFATCPLPPKENVLPIRIEAGEKAAHQ